MPQIEIQALMAKADYDTKRWNPWEPEKIKGKDVVIDTETKCPMLSNP